MTNKESLVQKTLSFYIYTMLVANRFFCFLLLLSICISSCSSGSEGSTENKPDSSAANATPVFDNSLPKGKILDSLACKNAGDQTYALYLPSSYSSNKSYPCIYFFDAHGRGMLPVNT